MYVETNTSPETTGAPDSDTQPAILCVDDDPCLLDGFRRQLRKRFRIQTAVGALEGLEAISRNGPFSVVVADLQMPGMDGIQFLTKVRSVSPNTVRIMLTGRADVSTAVAAVNQGNIFRFLVKPCAPLVIEKVLEAALDQYKLLETERQLMQDTMHGCLEMLTKILSLVQPKAFERATRVRLRVTRIAAAMGLVDTVQLETAAILSPIGWITLQPAILAKAIADEPMSEEERASFVTHASAAAGMLEKIPRLAQVARMIERQHFAFKDLPPLSEVGPSDPTIVGSQILKAAIDYDRLRKKHPHYADVIKQMRAETDVYMPEVVAAVAVAAQTALCADFRRVAVSDLAAGMVLQEDLKSEHGLLILRKGEEVTPTFVERLIQYGYGFPPAQKFKVQEREPEWR